MNFHITLNVAPPRIKPTTPLLIPQRTANTRGSTPLKTFKRQNQKGWNTKHWAHHLYNADPHTCICRDVFLRDRDYFTHTDITQSDIYSIVITHLQSTRPEGVRVYPEGLVQYVLSGCVLTSVFFVFYSDEHFFSYSTLLHCSLAYSVLY